MRSSLDEADEWDEVEVTPVPIESPPVDEAEEAERRLRFAGAAGAGAGAAIGELSKSFFV